MAMNMNGTRVGFNLYCWRYANYYIPPELWTKQVHEGLFVSHEVYHEYILHHFNVLSSVQTIICSLLLLSMRFCMSTMHRCGDVMPVDVCVCLPMYVIVST